MTASRRSSRDASLKRRVIGVCAMSTLHCPVRDKRGCHTHVLLIEELYVTPKWRGTRVGRCLLHAALTEPSRHGGTTRIACVVRRHAPQQAAARHIYRRMGLRPLAPRKNLVDAADRPAPLAPLYEGARDDREAYYEGWYDRGCPACFAEGLHHTPRESMVAGDFVAQNRTFIRELKAHHARTNGGDGADPYAVLAAAQRVHVAWSYDAVRD